MSASSLNLGILMILTSGPADHADGAGATTGSTTDEIAACRRGDRGALERVFRAHAGGLERLLARLVGPHADAEDLLQDTFSAAIEAFPRFRGEAAVKTWLHRIAINVANHHLRRPARTRDVPLDHDHDGAADPGEAPDQIVARRRAAVRLYAHLDRLDPKKRIALLLHVVEGLSIEEVAALTGASRTATKSRIFWARRSLLARLRHDPHLLECE